MKQRATARGMIGRHTSHMINFPTLLTMIGCFFGHFPATCRTFRVIKQLSCNAQGAQLCNLCLACMFAPPSSFLRRFRFGGASLQASHSLQRACFAQFPPGNYQCGFSEFLPNFAFDAADCSNYPVWFAMTIRRVLVPIRSPCLFLADASPLRPLGCAI